jgi:hypothetical protein
MPERAEQVRVILGETRSGSGVRRTQRKIIIYCRLVVSLRTPTIKMNLFSAVGLRTSAQPTTEFVSGIKRKGRKERKVLKCLSLRPLHLMNRCAFRQYYPNLLRTFWHLPLRTLR